MQIDNKQGEIEAQTRGMAFQHQHRNFHKLVVFCFPFFENTVYPTSAAVANTTNGECVAQPTLMVLKKRHHTDTTNYLLTD